MFISHGGGVGHPALPGLSRFQAVFLPFSALFRPFLAVFNVFFPFSSRLRGFA